MFFYNKTEQSATIPDLASDLKLAALEDVRKKEILVNCYILIKCANPYAVGDIVLIGDHRMISIFQYGNLVFRVIDCDLKKYICGDWSEKLADEVKGLEARWNDAKIKNWTQSFRNAAAERNYIVC